MISFPTPQKCTAIVDAVTRLDGAVYNIRFRVTDPAAFSFIAGQHGSFIIEQTIRRNYSFTSPPSVLPIVETCVDTTPMGLGSAWLVQLKIGDTINVLAPLGRFVVDKESPRKKVFVATGTGISAIRSMILDYLETCQVSSVKCQVGLYWGVRNEESMFWDEEFQALEKEHANFSFIRIVSQPKGNWQGRVGRVTDFVTKEEHDLHQSEFYLCGNREMIYDMKKLLVESSVPEEQVKSELFY